MLNTLVRAANTLTLAVILQEQSLVRAERLKADARRKERRWGVRKYDKENPIL